MKRVATVVLTLTLVLFSAAPVFAQTPPGAPTARAEDPGAVLLQEAIAGFQDSQFNDAILKLRDILLDPDYEQYHGDAYFWIAKSYMALMRLADAERNLEFFLLNYPDSPFYPEANYQKGRLLYLQGEYQAAIQVFQTFVEGFPTSPFIANAYYWSGESLYSLGHFDRAKELFERVVRDFPNSFRVEAARYRISLIELRGREEELLKLLRWSHEEYLDAVERFQRRERTYEEAIESYQRRLASLSTDDFRQEIERLSEREEELEEQLAARNATIEDLTAQVRELDEALSTAQAELALRPQAAVIDPAATEEVAQLQAELERRLELVSLKEEALDLRESLLDSLGDRGQ